MAKKEVGKDKTGPSPISQQWGFHEEKMFRVVSCMGRERKAGKEGQKDLCSEKRDYQPSVS